MKHFEGVLICVSYLLSIPIPLVLSESPISNKSLRRGEVLHEHNIDDVYPEIGHSLDSRKLRIHETVSSFGVCLSVVFASF